MNELMAPQKNVVGQTDQWLDSQLDGWVDKLINNRKTTGWVYAPMDR